MKPHLAPTAAVLTAGALMVAAAAPAAVADPPDRADHGHILVLDVEVKPHTFPPEPIKVGGCVDLAAGRVLPRTAHEDHRHEDPTGGAFTARTGHIVIPTAPFRDMSGKVVAWRDCASFLAFFGLG